MSTRQKTRTMRRQVTAADVSTREDQKDMRSLLLPVSAGACRQQLHSTLAAVRLASGRAGLVALARESAALRRRGCHGPLRGGRAGERSLLGRRHERAVARPHLTAPSGEAALRADCRADARERQAGVPLLPHDEEDTGVEDGGVGSADNTDEQRAGELVDDTSAEQEERGER